MKRVALLLALLIAAGTTPLRAQPYDPTFKTGQRIELRAYGVPKVFSITPKDQAQREIIEAFRRRFPTIDPVSTEGLELPGLSTMDVVPMMQIAGGIPRHVPYVNFRQSHTYISKKLLYPLDRYIEELAGVTIEDSAPLSDDQYVAKLQQGPGWTQIQQRAPRQCWEVMRRDCPYEDHCPHRAQWGLPPVKSHEHVWAYPVGPLVIGLQYDKSLFAEHEDLGVEQRVPRDWEEMIRWAKIICDPSKNQFGLRISVQRPAWHFLSFLYSAGGLVVDQNENGDWYCVMDSPEAVEAGWFYSRLRHEPIIRGDKTINGVIGAGDVSVGEQTRYAMEFSYLDARLMDQAANVNIGFGPVPMGPDGKRGSEFNSMMCGIFSGLADRPRMRQAAWEYVKFYDGDEARQIRTDVMIKAGYGRFVRPDVLDYLNTDGRYDPIVAQITDETRETYRVVFESGVPEPYGENCQYIYEFMMKPLGEMWQSDIVIDAVRQYAAATSEEEKAAAKQLGKDEIQRIFTTSVAQINQKMLGILPPKEQRKRSTVSWIVIAGVVIIFVAVLRQVFKAFRPPEEEGKAGLQLSKYWPAYLLMSPAVMSIAVWMYWPLVKGTMIAFQDYSVLGDSVYIGAKNFADVLWDPEFWHSLWVSLKYGLLFMVFGFCAPIALALLLQEVPRGKVFYRTIYYLPAVLSGLVVIFLWKAFYGTDGLINVIINGVIKPLNAILGTQLSESTTNWLDHRPTVLFWCLLPTVWAGMGPGCLIYLAAFKTVPDELYEAADIDGAGIWHKVMHIAVPSIKALILINFIGAMIGAIRGAGGFMLAMTGGGPYGAKGGATEVIGLKLWTTTFGYLKFGTAAAMAWVVGAMLIGFTVMQLKRLSRMEFRAAATEEAK